MVLDLVSEPEWSLGASDWSLSFGAGLVPTHLSFLWLDFQEHGLLLRLLNVKSLLNLTNFM